jgi:hypothetical protein
MSPQANSDWTAAHNKYLEYQKAYEDRRASIVKIANDAVLDAERQNYERGLTDLRTYLETKQALEEESLYAEVVAKRNELANAQQALKELKAVTGPKGEGNPSKDAENYHAALLKVEQASKAVNEAEGKLNLERKKGEYETQKQIEDTTRSYREMRAQLLDMQGDYVAAALIRRQLDEESVARRKLIADAMTGDKAAMEAYWAAEAQDANKSAEAAYKQKAQYDQLGIQLLELAGQYEKAALAKRALEQASPEYQNLPAAVKAQRDQLADLAQYDARQKHDRELASLRFGNSELINATRNPLGMANEFEDRKDRADSQILEAQQEINRSNELRQRGYQVDEERYRLLLEKKRLLSAQYTAGELAVQQDYNNQVRDMSFGVAAATADMLNTMSGQNLAAAIASLAIQKGIALT